MMPLVYAMARPRRPETEREAVVRAAAGLPGSAAKRARVIARDVAKAVMEDEPVVQMIGMMSALLVQTPITVLANDPDIDTAALVRAERLARFEARGCRHLAEHEWKKEDREIQQALQSQLARRYARHIREEICP